MTAKPAHLGGRFGVGGFATVAIPLQRTLLDGDGRGVPVNTTAEATAHAMRWLEGFPNGKMTVRNEIESGPWIIQEITMEGVYSGPFQTSTAIVSPTGRKLVGKGVQILRVENGTLKRLGSTSTSSTC